MSYSIRETCQNPNQPPASNVAPSSASILEKALDRLHQKCNPDDSNPNVKKSVHDALAQLNSAVLHVEQESKASEVELKGNVQKHFTVINDESSARHARVEREKYDQLKKVYYDFALWVQSLTHDAVETTLSPSTPSSLCLSPLPSHDPMVDSNIIPALGCLPITGVSADNSAPNSNLLALGSSPIVHQEQK